ncbi:alpha/beta hydrolase [Nodosilinea sp. P-1105]|uniref:alpha/beta hydrolase n=1 Tax=Nodosilinea sp. P-1105 TaxID=2546229 RepID=UPI00146B7EE9|nr:alpha/beta hydrolase [Nodosilinea sp. P-1105]NMF85208.1 alpha/beta hydrolase [Nodosilinea sp. P-1105]
MVSRFFAQSLGRPQFAWLRHSIAPFSALLTTLTTLALAAPGLAVETIVIEYGPFSRSISTASLERFATTGVADGHLGGLLQKINAEQQQGVRAALQASRSIDVVPLTQWLYSPMGEDMLRFAGTLIKTEASQNGQLALRSALITTAAAGDISLLAVIRNFPTGGMRIDLSRIVAAAQEVIAEADNTAILREAVAQQSAADAALPPPFDLAALPDITQPGPYSTRQISLTINDTERNRAYPVEVIVPDNLEQLPGTLPIAVISHGLGDTRTNFLDLGVHLASYGVVAALPEHIGSNLAQKQALFSGLSNEAFRAREFIDRPLDITRLLDELARTNQADYWGKLNLDQVAVMGHSFGGYTALALAGATVDFDLLRQQCIPVTNVVLNVAELLECRALELDDDPAVIETLGQTGLRDRRVKAVLAHSPVTRLFGQSGISRIQIPTILKAGEFDIATPAVPEQLSTFRWLTIEDKYFYLGERSSHTPELTRLINRFLHLDRDLTQGIDEAIELNRGIISAVSLAFVKVYLTGDLTYEPFLRSAYVEAVSQAPFNRYLVRELLDSLLDLLDE